MYKISIIGLGYVGLPLAIELSKYFKVIGYDINKKRINNLNKGIDSNNDIQISSIKNPNIVFTSIISNLKDSDTYIITVPTPILKNNKPDLNFLRKAFQLISKNLSKGDLVVLESTVYPGLTEDLANQYFVNKKKLKLNTDFYLGYSPERINPGDNINNIKNIKKIISASNKSSLIKMKKIYSKIIKAGLHETKNIKIAESAKVIENAQRDINIAFVNEIFKIFDNLNIDTHEVLDAASTKWNFLPFKPGLVGGHCIGVDPYYLTYLSKRKGYNPKVILSGRNVNDNMHKALIRSFTNYVQKNNFILKSMKVLFMGFAFKENCSDIRNTKIYDFHRDLKNKVKQIDIYDPYVNQTEVKNIYQIKLIKSPKSKNYDAIFILLGHDKFLKLGIGKISMFGKKKHFVLDLKNTFKRGFYSI